MPRAIPTLTLRLCTLALFGLALLLLDTLPAYAASGLTEFEAHCSDSGIVIHFTYVEDPLAEFILSENPGEGAQLVATLNEAKDGLTIALQAETADA